MNAAPRVRRPSSTLGTVVKPLAASIIPKPSSLASPPSTSRYPHVHSTLNTGPNALNTPHKPQRLPDPFPRIHPTALAALIRAHSDAEKTVYALTTRGASLSHARDWEDVRVSGEALGTAGAPSYVLLDVRGAEEYAAGHVVGAVSFPAVLVRRDQYPSILVQSVTAHTHSQTLPLLLPLLSCLSTHPPLCSGDRSAAHPAEWWFCTTRTMSCPPLAWLPVWPSTSSTAATATCTC